MRKPREGAPRGPDPDSKGGRKTGIVRKVLQKPVGKIGAVGLALSSILIVGGAVDARAGVSDMDPQEEEIATTLEEVLVDFNRPDAEVQVDCGEVPLFVRVAGPSAINAWTGSSNIYIEREHCEALTSRDSSPRDAVTAALELSRATAESEFNVGVTDGACKEKLTAWIYPKIMVNIGFGSTDSYEEIASQHIKNKKGAESTVLGLGAFSHDPEKCGKTLQQLTA